ncbi:hypothetical protein [Bacillus pseudomycoides]|uniref:hypothetical protein n=1 Tax=Bacillus pseudomycoides TaxID=64104 RepID=UPI00196AD1D3|nr:hypothetical protein [Bacillus pseudomycoides]
MDMIAEKERTESRRRQAQGIKIVKEKRVIKDDPTFMDQMQEILRNKLFIIKSSKC